LKIKSEVAPAQCLVGGLNLPEIVTIDGRGMSIHDAVTEMWERMRPLEQRGFNPVSNVEIVDTKTKEIIESFQLTDPEFQVHLQSEGKAASDTAHREDTHIPEKKEHFRYLARIQLADKRENRSFKL
jgi:hypothetical protein